MTEGRRLQASQGQGDHVFFFSRRSKPSQTSAPVQGHRNESFLLCRPRGGLNDTLCQIEKCWQYAGRSNRTLVIDTRDSGLFGEFSDFFALTDASIKAIPHMAGSGLPSRTPSCYPPQISARLDKYRAIYSKESGNFIEKKSGVPVTFDFDQDYRETVLVHEQCGGGTASFAVLERIRLSDAIRQEVVGRLSRLGTGYVAIHVRNTDYQTDYEPLFNKLRHEVAGKRLLVCSDDANVISEARRYFYLSTILSSSAIPFTGQKPLHMQSTMKSKRDREIATINTIVDLCALGLARKLYFMNVTAGYPSGFSSLARHLNENKNLVLDLLK